ncbi:MAG: hypothetical protein KDD11_02445 [Acidobacteria bacterium]|nr:hypothetical protein [Acidobacteriota bacterium]
MSTASFPSSVPSSRPVSSRRHGLSLAAAVGLAALLLALAGCRGDAGGPRAERGSALWIAAPGPGADGAVTGRLAAAGIERYFLEAARLSWSGTEPQIERLELPRLPPRTPVILAVDGRFAPPSGDAESIARRLQRELTSLAFLVEDEGYLVDGFLLDLDPGRDLERYASVLAALRAGRQDRRSVAAAVWARHLAAGTTDPGLAALAASVDNLVAWLYGQRPEEPPRDDAWDLGAVDSALGVLEALGVPYRVGVVTLNRLEHLSAGGEILERRADGRLETLALDRRLELEPGFVLFGLDCRRYDFKARSSFVLEGWQVRSGEILRVQGLSYVYLAELQRRLAARDLEHHLGELYLRLPAPGERISPALDTLLASLGGPLPDPELEASVEQVPGGYRASLRHVGIRISELVFVDANFLDLELRGGTFGAVDAGGFERYQLLRRTRDGGVTVSLHQATLLRLYRPILEPGDEVTTGRIEVRGAGGPVSLTPKPSFLLPDGSPMSAATSPWPVPATPAP